MGEYTLSKKAVEDLGKIWNYTVDHWSEQQADKYHRSVIEACQSVADNPSIGKSYDGVRDQLMGYRVGKHLLFYRKLNKDGVEISRILHNRMDLKRRTEE